MSSLWDAVFIQVLDCTGPLTLNLSGTSYISVLRKFPFSSVRTIADSLNIPVSTIYTHLVEKIDLGIFLFRWVPRTLTGEPR
jgi:hypothetical protein